MKEQYPSKARYDFSVPEQSASRDLQQISREKAWFQFVQNNFLWRTFTDF